MNPTTIIDKDNRPGFLIDGFFVAFPPEGDIVQEHEDGSMSILVDIYKIDGDNRISLARDEVTPELEEKINDHINHILLQAVERAEKEHAGE